MIEKMSLNFENKYPNKIFASADIRCINHCMIMTLVNNIMRWTVGKRVITSLEEKRLARMKNLEILNGNSI